MVLLENAAMLVHNRDPFLLASLIELAQSTMIVSLQLIQFSLSFYFSFCHFEPILENSALLLVSVCGLFEPRYELGATWWARDRPYWSRWWVQLAALRSMPLTWRGAESTTGWTPRFLTASPPRSFPLAPSCLVSSALRSFAHSSLIYNQHLTIFLRVHLLVLPHTISTPLISKPAKIMSFLHIDCHLLSDSGGTSRNSL